MKAYRMIEEASEEQFFYLLAGFVFVMTLVVIYSIISYGRHARVVQAHIDRMQQGKYLEDE